MQNICHTTPLSGLRPSVMRMVEVSHTSACIFQAIFMQQKNSETYLKVRFTQLSGNARLWLMQLALSLLLARPMVSFPVIYHEPVLNLTVW